MKKRADLKDFYRQYRVNAESVEDFLDRYCKHERYHGRSPEYATALLAAHKMNVEEEGWTSLSHGESVTGKIVSYFENSGQIQLPQNFWG